MRPRNPLDSRIDCEPEMGTPVTISTARFPVIHGPMRAAPLWHARIGRWVTGAAGAGLKRLLNTVDWERASCLARALVLRHPAHAGLFV